MSLSTSPLHLSPRLKRRSTAKERRGVLGEGDPRKEQAIWSYWMGFGSPRRSVGFAGSAHLTHNAMCVGCADNEGGSDDDR